MHHAGSLVIRSETAGTEDYLAIHSVNREAFGRPDEANLVDSLRTEGVVLASLVAELEDCDELEKSIVGHILFSRMYIETATNSVPAVALAPIAVLPKHQRQGIGGELIRHGLNVLKLRGEQIAIVLGHPDYYPRFGFSSAKAESLESPFPPKSFMAFELDPGALDGLCGKVRYPAAFGLGR